MKNKAFVFTGIAFLMIIPSIILAVSFVSMQRTGDTAVATKTYSDRVFYAFANIETNFNSTGESLVTYYGCNESDIRGYLNGTWGPFMEQDFASSLEVDITLPEDEINASYDASNQTIKMGHLNVNQGIPINITDADGNIRLDTLISPLTVSTTIGPTSGCTDTDSDGYNASGIGCNCGTADCNDTNSSISPVAVEVCNGVDDDCNVSTNENSTIGMNVSAPLEACGVFTVNASYRLDCNDNSTATLYHNMSAGGWIEWGQMDYQIDRDQKVFFEEVNFTENGDYAFNVTFSDANGILANTSVIFNESGINYTTYVTSCCPDEDESSMYVCRYQDGCSGNDRKVNVTVYVKDPFGTLTDADNVDLTVTIAGSPNDLSPMNKLSTGVYNQQYTNCADGGDLVDVLATVNLAGCTSFDLSSSGPQIKNLPTCPS